MSSQEFSLEITKYDRARQDGGVWVYGRVDGYSFQALVFAEHADSADNELNGSRIAKLWIRRMADKKVTFNFDRGTDLEAQDAETANIVGFLCEGLANLAFGK